MQSVQYLDAEVIRVGSLISSSPGNILPVKAWSQQALNQSLSSTLQVPVQFDTSDALNGDTHISLHPDRFTFENTDTVPHTYLVTGYVGVGLPFAAIATNFIQVRIAAPYVLTQGPSTTTLNTGDYDFLQCSGILLLNPGDTMRLECKQAGPVARTINQLNTSISFILLK
jgi:hypothetical protein